jgi:hypothetical protein
MNKLAYIFFVCCFLGLPLNRALANDTVVGLGAGGLEFRTTNEVSMVKERLTISPKKIDVRYTFRNVTDHPVELMIAFPLPVIDYSRLSPRGPYVNIPNSHNVNFVDFKTLVDGKPVITLTETKALLGDRDISNDLKNAGIRYWIPGYGTDYGVIDQQANARQPDALKQVQALPKSKQQQLVKIGALETGEPKDDVYPFPKWRLVTLYYWTQVFPPGKDVIIQHTYKPVSTMSEGFNIQTIDEKTMKFRPVQMMGTPDARYPKGLEYLKEYCMDDNFYAGAKKKPGSQTHSIDYIIKTANAWHKPIGEFTLVLQTDAPENLVSICMDNLKQTSPTTFEVTKYNFAPAEDLKVFFLVKR